MYPNLQRDNYANEAANALSSYHSPRQLAKLGRNIHTTTATTMVTSLRIAVTDPPAQKLNVLKLYTVSHLNLIGLHLGNNPINYLDEIFAFNFLLLASLSQ